jgi:tRNA-splicing endonuclease subunit Sen15, fungi type
MEETSHAQQLAETVLDNLRYQHDWTELKILTHSPTESGGAGGAFARPMIIGLPPRRLYVHPDDQISMVKSSALPDGKIFDTPETEWILATHISEKWTIRALADVFDSLPSQQQHQPSPPHPERPKRIVLATVHNDSTVVYYILHDGIVKPRQN